MWIPYDLTDIWLTTCGCPILIFRVFWPFVRTPMNPAGKQHSIMVCDRGLKLWIRLALYPQPNPISRTSQSLCSRGSNRIGWPNVCNCPKRLHTELRNMCDLQFFCAFLHIWLLPFHHNLPAQSPKAPKFGRTQKCWLAKRTPNQKQISACWPSASSNCSLPSRSREKNSPSAQSWNSFFDLQGCSERIQFSSSTVFFRSLLVLFSCLYFATAWPVYYPCLSVNQIPIFSQSLRTPAKCVLQQLHRRIWRVDGICIFFMLDIKLKQAATSLPIKHDKTCSPLRSRKY